MPELRLVLFSSYGDHQQQLVDAAQELHVVQWK